MRRIGCVVAAAVGLAGSEAPGRVFWMGGARDHGAVSAGQPGWTGAWKTRVRINAGEGVVEVLGSGQPAASAARTLDAAYRAMGASSIAFAGGNLAWGAAREGDRVIRWLAADVGRRHECVVFRIEQTVAEFRASMRPPDGHRIGDVPWPPGARPRSYLADVDRGIEIEQSGVRSPPGEAAGTLMSMMESQGWSPLSPRDSRGPAPQAMVYRRGRDIAVVQVTLGRDGETRILRLKRRE